MAGGYPGCGWVIICVNGLSRFGETTGLLYPFAWPQTKATTLGLGALVLASIAYFNVVKGELSVQQLLIALFLFITAPITAHMLIKAALHLKLEGAKQTSGKEKAEPLRPVSFLRQNRFQSKPLRRLAPLCA